MRTATRPMDTAALGDCVRTGLRARPARRPTNARPETVWINTVATARAAHPAVRVTWLDCWGPARRFPSIPRMGPVPAVAPRKLRRPACVMVRAAANNNLRAQRAISVLTAFAGFPARQIPTVLPAMPVFPVLPARHARKSTARPAGVGETVPVETASQAVAETFAARLAALPPGSRHAATIISARSVARHA